MSQRVWQNQNGGTAAVYGQLHGHVDGLCGLAPRAGGVASRREPGM